MEMNDCIPVILCGHKKSSKLIHQNKFILLLACVFHRTKARGIRPVFHPVEVF